jgi:hypothetical protein
MEAELLIFIAQTGMNLAQAYKIKIGKFSYQSDTSGYQVRRVFKQRRQGEVEFHIYSEYRTYFENYLEWRNELFGDDPEGRLFPIASPKERPEDSPTDFSAIRKRCKRAGIKFVGASELRKSRTNWLLRRSKSESLTAEMGQHTESTLLQNYARPNHQVAITEISRFLATIDPALAPPGPGACVRAQPLNIPEPDHTAPTPDCINPAGCLFCEHQRDIESLDHFWSLATYRHCKTVELSKYRSTVDLANPTKLVIENITQRFNQFREGSAQAKIWLEEAQLRVDEGEYHPQWDIFIQLMDR